MRSRRRAGVGLFPGCYLSQYIKIYNTQKTGHPCGGQFFCHIDRNPEPGPVDHTVCLGCSAKPPEEQRDIMRIQRSPAGAGSEYSISTPEVISRKADAQRAGRHGSREEDRPSLSGWKRASYSRPPARWHQTHPSWRRPPRRRKKDVPFRGAGCLCASLAVLSCTGRRGGCSEAGRGRGAGWMGLQMMDPA